MIVTVLVTFLLLALARAQYGGPAPSPTPTTAASATVPSAPADSQGQMNIDVAYQGSFVFHPANITAPNGTFVTFWFPSNGLDHSVTQSSFDNPCRHLEPSGNNSAGFDSGLQSAKKFAIQIVDDTKPIWFHCKQVLHCGMGMVGSINAPTSGQNTFEIFRAAAMKVGSSEQTENDSGPVTGGVNGIATAPPASSTGGGGGSGNSGGGSNSALPVAAYGHPLSVLTGALSIAFSVWWL